MRIEIQHRCSDFDSYRAAAVKSMFNVDTGANFNKTFDLPIENTEWQIGVVVGPSGSGKTSIGKKLGAIYAPEWAKDVPVVDAIAPNGAFNDVTAALASVGLGTVPAWLRPYAVLSNGEQFRANLARLICEAPEFAVLDEFSSVVDRQIAQIGAGVGMRFLNACCEMWWRGQNRYHKPLRTIFHTSHPALANALRRDKKWTQVSAVLYGGNKAKSAASIKRSDANNTGSGYGGHFRAVQGFRYLGETPCE